MKTRQVLVAIIYTLLFVSTINAQGIFQPYAGEDFIVCGDSTNLHAIPTPGTTGSWYSNPGAYFSDPNDPNTQVFFPITTSFGIGQFVWIESDGNYSNSDTVLVTFYDHYSAVHEMQGIQIDYPDGIIPVCGLQYNQLDANYYAGITGYWIDIESDTQTFYEAVHTNTDTLIISDNQYGLHTLYWVLENGIMPDGQPV